MPLLTPPPRPAPPTAPLLSLQVLRAVAALLVLVHHAGFDADTIAGRTDVVPFGLDRVFDWSFGIHLFFVISGFIMVRTVRGFGSARGAAVFMLRRIIRVVPLYWLLTTLVLVGSSWAPDLLNSPPGSFGVVLDSYLFVPVARAGGELRPVLGQGWTLDYEMFFYVLFAAAMLLSRRLGLAALATALIGLVVLGKTVHFSGPAGAVWTDGLLLEFLLGLGLGLAAEAGLRLGRTTALIAVAGGAVAAVMLGPISGWFENVDPWIRGGVPAAAIVGGCVLGPRWPARRSILALALVGDASYSLYLSHPFVIRLLRNAWLATAPGTLPLGLYLGLAGAAAVAAALLLYRWIERPMTLALQRRSRFADSVRRPILPDAAGIGAARDG